MVMNSQWELFTTIPHNLSMWLESKSWWLGSKREQAKRKHPKRKEVKVPSLLRSGLRSHRILCRPYFIHQSNHRASPDSRRGEISLNFGHEKWHGYPQPYIYIYINLCHIRMYDRDLLILRKTRMIMEAGKCKICVGGQYTGDPGKNYSLTQKAVCW